MEEFKKTAKDLGFNSSWDETRRKYQFYNHLAFLGVFLIIALLLGAGLFWLVNEGRIDNTTFATLIAVLLGAILDRSLSERRSK